MTMPMMRSARCSSRSTGVGREREADAGSVREVGTLKFTNGALAVAKADSGVTGTLSLTGVPLTPGATVLVQRVPAGTLILIR